MGRLSRHDHILIARRKRHRARVNRPRPWLRFFQVVAVLLIVGLLINVGVVATGAAIGVGIYNSYAEQLPDASIIESDIFGMSIDDVVAEAVAQEPAFVGITMFTVGVWTAAQTTVAAGAIAATAKTRRPSRAPVKPATAATRP